MLVPMCNLYRSTSGSDAQAVWKAGNPLAIDWPGGIVGPRKNGLFLRPARGGDGLAMVVGRWGLIPWFADTADIRYSTNNARAEEVAHKPSYKLAWQRGQRCIIPADCSTNPTGRPAATSGGGSAAPTAPPGAWPGSGTPGPTAAPAR